MVHLLLPVVLFQVAAQVSSLGSLIYASMSTAGLSGPALMALLQALANGGGLFLVKASGHRWQKRMVPAYFFGLVLFSALSFVSALLSGQVSAVLLFIRLLFGAIVMGLLLARMPALLAGDEKRGNQIFQTWMTISALIGFGMAPILASSIQSLFGVDLALNGIALLAILRGNRISEMTDSNLESEEDAGSYPADLSAIASMGTVPLTVAGLTCLLWCFGGFFHVVEVPLLLQRFHLLNHQVSMVFIFTIAVNILSVAFLSRAWVARKSWSVIIASTCSLGLSCVLYIQAESMAVVWLVVFVIGAANGAFNLAQSTILHASTKGDVRIHAFLLSRFMGQVGLMFGALLAGSGLFYSVERIATPKKAGQEEIETSGNLHVRLRRLPSRWEPYRTEDTSSMLVIRQIFDTLFDYDSRNNLIPRLAKSLAWADSSSTLFITLRDDARFSNGDALEAIDVVKSLEEARSELGQSGSWAFRHVSTIRAVGRDRVEFRFSRPFSLMPAILASPYFGIFKRLPDRRVLGTGEYSLKNEEPGIIRLARNPFTTNRQGPEAIAIYDHTDEAVLYNLSDEPVLPREKAQSLARVEFPSLQLILFIPNFKDPALASRAARCALIAALSEAAPNVYSQWRPAEFGLPLSTKQPLLPKDDYFNKLRVSKDVVIHYSDSVAKFEPQLNSEISSRLRVQGFEVEFKRVPITELLALGRNGRFSGLLFGFMPDFVHPYGLIAPLFQSGQTFNFGSYANPKINRLLDEALAATEKLSQTRIYSEALQTIQDDCSAAFLGTQSGVLYLDAAYLSPEIGQLGTHQLRFSTLKLRGKSP